MNLDNFSPFFLTLEGTNKKKASVNIKIFSVSSLLSLNVQLEQF